MYRLPRQHSYYFGQEEATTLAAVTFSTFEFTLNRTENHYSIPSLKSDSPAIRVSVMEEVHFLSMAKTAMGSVGAISAPKSKQST